MTILPQNSTYTSGYYSQTYLIRNFTKLANGSFTSYFYSSTQYAGAGYTSQTAIFATVPSVTQTTGTTYLTRSSTSATQYLTRSSTSGYSGKSSSSKSIEISSWL